MWDRHPGAPDMSAGNDRILARALVSAMNDDVGQPLDRFADARFPRLNPQLSSSGLILACGRTYRRARQT